MYYFETHHHHLIEDFAFPLEGLIGIIITGKEKKGEEDMYMLKSGVENKIFGKNKTK